MIHLSRSNQALHWRTLCLIPLLWCLPTEGWCEVDPQSGIFSYSNSPGIDETLGQIALYLINRDRREGSTFVSQEVRAGIVGYLLRYFDNGNRTIDSGDWLGTRRYRIPAEPDTTKPEGYYKATYIEFVDVGLDGIDRQDYYFIEGRRFDLNEQTIDILEQYQVQIESGITAFIQEVGYQSILEELGAFKQAAIKKVQAYEDGSLPARMVLGLELNYVFRPIVRNETQLGEQEMKEELRQRIGFVYSATTGFTDIQGYRFRDIADEHSLLQRTYDAMETRTIRLIVDALFDTDGDGIITQENIKNGYTRFREIHQQLSENARGLNRRTVLPNEKLARLRQEYESVHDKPFKF